MFLPTGPGGSNIADQLALALAQRYTASPPSAGGFDADAANGALINAYLASHSVGTPPAAPAPAPAGPTQGGLGGEGQYGGDDYAHAGWGTAQPYDYAGAHDPYGGGYQHANQAPIPAAPRLPFAQQLGADHPFLGAPQHFVGAARSSQSAIDGLRARYKPVRHGF